MDRSAIESLRSFVDDRVRQEGCDHTHRFTQEWARRESVDWNDLLDILEANGGFCDCEVVLNLPDELEVQSPATPVSPDQGNPWLIPPSFECDASACFNKVIVCQANLGRNTYASDGEILVPAPKGAKARRRVRKSVNFFVGCQSGMPNEIGVVNECEAVSAVDFARQVVSSKIEELAQFSSLEAAFVLSRVAGLRPSTPVGTYYDDRIGIASKHQELAVHRVFLRL